MTDFKTLVTTMAEARPDARVSLIVDLALALEETHPPDLNDREALARWAAKFPAVTDCLKADKKINAIKELRALTSASLKQSKDAIDFLAGEPF